MITYLVPKIGDCLDDIRFVALSYNPKIIGRVNPQFVFYFCRLVRIFRLQIHIVAEDGVFP